jgi:hypothetical protein
MTYKILRIIAAILLFWALDRHPYSYYTFLRFVVCGVAGYGAFISIKLDKNVWAWIFGITAVLFNPILPIHLNRDLWAIIDVAVALVLIVSLFVLNRPKIAESDNIQNG